MDGHIYTIMGFWALHLTGVESGFAPGPAVRYPGRHEPSQEIAMTDESDFIKYRPKITEVTGVKAAQAYGQGDEILSLNGKITAIDAFILLLATDAETHGPYLMNAVCARELCALLLTEGFGPQAT
jgi:hypothetical protein